MKRFLVLLLIGFVRSSPLIVEPVSHEPVVQVEPVKEPIAAVPHVADVAPVVPVAVPLVPVEPIVPIVPVAPVEDPQLLLSEPIDKATKLIIDLDEHLRKYLPAEDEVVTTPIPAIVYSGDGVVVDGIVGDKAEVDTVSVVERQNQMTALIDQVNRLAESIENTITDLVARRRYVTAAMLRSMLNYVRRVRVNLERLQNRLQSVQAIATVQNNQPAGAAAPGGASAVPGAAFFNTIRDRINRITEEIGALVSRIRGSFTPIGGPTPSPLPPLQTAASVSNAVANIAAAAAALEAIGTQ